MLMSSLAQPEIEFTLPLGQLDRTFHSPLIRHSHLFVAKPAATPATAFDDVISRSSGIVAECVGGRETQDYY